MEKFPDWVKTRNDYERWKRGEKPPENLGQSDDGKMRFQNPNNGYIAEVEMPGIYTLFFGCFYFAKHGAWTYAFIAFFSAVLTAGLSWFIFPFLGKKIIRESYLRKGWIELKN